MNLLLGLNPYALAAKALGALLLAAALFGGGYYVAVRQYEGTAATAAQQAAVAAQQAQAHKDAVDLAAAKADSAKRQAANQTASQTLAKITKDRSILVPTPAQCKVPAAAMHALNDPSLIGAAP